MQKEPKETKDKEKSSTPQRIKLNPDLKSPRAQEFENKLMARIVGQERAVRRIANLYQIHLAGLANPGRPVGTMLFLGPTGSGKTRVVEAAAEVLYTDPNAVIKVDCAEFQHSHEIAKLIGSPPGYLGHRETSPMLTQENLDRYHTEKDQISFVLFDEIEKASDALWQLLLGILDKATLTLGDNRRVDFSKAMIFMTSNLGAKEMSDLISGSIGFAPTKIRGEHDNELDQKIYRTALEAAKRKFSPEFMNRIDKVVVFRSLKEHHLHQILDLELKAVQDRIMKGTAQKFIFKCSPEAKKFLLDEGIDYKYGARHLKRSIERFLVYPLSNLVATEQVSMGDLVFVEFDSEEEKLIFSKEVGGALVNTEEYAEHFNESTSLAPRPKAASASPKNREQE
ncbi:MAG: ATP-dependent Clp protease ATP-binding subunit [Blastocatellia bacterium]|nr:ATP-dependent Clp protease ATP-binding subunit [Blastocatellia bacterium]